MTGSNDWTRPRSWDQLSHINLTVGEKTIRLFALAEDDHVFATVRETGMFYEEALLRFLGAFLEPEDLVVDVGANIGNHTAYFAGVLGCRVHAFEAVPILADVLALTVRANFLDSRVRLEPCAVGDRSGLLGIASWNPANSGATRLRAEVEGCIPVVALDEVRWLQIPRAIKIDVEGMELEVLQGAVHLIDKHRPLLIVEALDAEADAAIREWMDHHGYAVLGVFNATPTLVCTPITGTARSTSDAAIYRTLEHLGARIDDMHTHLDRLGRYTRQVQIAVENGLAHTSDPSVPEPGRAQPVSTDPVVHVLQMQNAELKAKLDALEKSVRTSVHTSKEEVPAHG